MEYILDGPQSKLTLLFLLDKMEIPLTQFNLLDICTSTNQWLGYMDCIEIIDQLINAKFIFKTDDEGQEIRYGITYEGRACLSDFYQRIPASLREKITQYANGGLPSVGEMFIARESGPELVGKIGNNTAIMNNMQIVDSVRAGVYEAVSMAMNQQNGQISKIDVHVHTDEGVVVDRINQKTIQTGVCPINIPA